MNLRRVRVDMEKKEDDTKSGKVLRECGAD